MNMSVDLLGVWGVTPPGNPPRVTLAQARKDLASLTGFLAPRGIVHADEAARFAMPTIDIPMHDLLQVDAILVLGSNDLNPIHQAADLFRLVSNHNPALRIVTCGRGGQGGKGGHLCVPGPLIRTTEAQCYADGLFSAGVPESAILLDPESTNTGENIENAQMKLKEAGVSAKRVAIVQTPAAQLRANLVFEKKWKTGWEYYISYPPAHPPIDSMRTDKLGFHLAYFLRELATTLRYSYLTDFQTKRVPPVKLVNLLIRYFFALSGVRLTRSDCFKPDSLVQMDELFRANFRIEEDKWLAK